MTRRERGRGVVAVRLFRMVDLLSARRLSYYDLAAEFGVSKRTILRDLDVLREVGFTIDVASVDADDQRRASVRIQARGQAVA